MGKARDLRRRLAQYAHFSGPSHSKTAAMLARVERIETILTATEKDALILEASLIKKHRPRYNVILRDDKNYPLIKVTTKDRWPRMVVTRKRLRDGSRYFGPFSSASAMRSTLKLLYSLFPLRRCRTVRRRERPCLNHQMGRCLAPCTGRVDPEEYQRMVGEVVRILEGRKQEVLDDLQRKMRSAAERLAFEEAARYRDQIRALEKTLEQQMIVAEHHQDQDVFGLARKGGSVALAILFIRSGILSGAQTFFLADPLGEDDRILRETMLQYYSTSRQPPPELLLPLLPADRDLLQGHLADLRGGPVKLSRVQRGRRRRLVAMATSNAEQVFSQRARKEKSWQTLAAGLQQALRLDRSPELIECLDISNLGGESAIGSLVCFRQGEKEKKRFRHYRIRQKTTPDDYAMMREVLSRRMERMVEKNDHPDMLLVDGGKGQLNVALAVCREFSLEDRIDLVAIAKEKQGEGEKLFRPGRKNPVLLPPHSPVLLYLMRIRDEAHRFGITCHRRLRRKSTLQSPLDGIQGIGKKRKQLLLRHLGSFRRVLAASPEELASVPTIGPLLARSIHSQLHDSGSTRPGNRAGGSATDHSRSSTPQIP